MFHANWGCMADFFSSIWYFVKFIWFLVVTLVIIGAFAAILIGGKAPDNDKGFDKVFRIICIILGLIAIYTDIRYVYPESKNSDSGETVQIVQQETPKVQREVPDNKQSIKLINEDILDSTNVGTDRYIYANLSKLSERNLKFVLNDITSMSGEDVAAYNRFYEIANGIIDKGNLGSLLSYVNKKRSEIKNNKAAINNFNYKKIELSEKELAAMEKEIDQLKSQNKQLNNEIAEIVTKMHLTQANPKITDVLIRLSPKQKLIKFYIFNEIIRQMPDNVNVDSNEVKKKFLEIQILLHRLSDYIIKDALGELDTSLKKINQHIENTKQHIRLINKKKNSNKNEKTIVKLNTIIETDDRLLNILEKVRTVITKLKHSFDVKKETLHENLDIVLIEYEGAVNLSSVSSDLDNIASLKDVLNGFSIPEQDSEFMNDLTNDELDRLEEIFQ